MNFMASKLRLVALLFASSGVSRSKAQTEREDSLNHFGSGFLSIALENIRYVLNDELSPEVRFIVASTPECGSRSGEPPFDLPVMRHVENLVRWDCQERLRHSFDFAGSTSADKRDCSVDWSSPESIKGSFWFKGYTESQKRSLITLAQDADTRSVLLSIRGGPVSQLEAQELPNIVKHATTDAKTLGLRPNFSYRGPFSFGEFLDVFDDKPITEFCKGTGCDCGMNAKHECVQSWSCGQFASCHGTCSGRSNYTENESWRLVFGAPSHDPDSEAFARPGERVFYNRSYGPQAVEEKLLRILRGVKQNEGKAALNCHELASMTRYARGWCVNKTVQAEAAEMLSTLGCRTSTTCDPKRFPWLTLCVSLAFLVCALLSFRFCIAAKCVIGCDHCDRVLVTFGLGAPRLSTAINSGTEGVSCMQPDGDEEGSTSDSSDIGSNNSGRGCHATCE
eukprot:TRINITY_DN16881_c0_g8_i1.p1 TRINITY_DN16881_c0_g8~~TRINITY_DN16881_c0_g8_i1.p1  ORF type:complete len:451 (+),score=37.07 TRINITY_DN16881_c0_g8_i1:47-1399(+)